MKRSKRGEAYVPSAVGGSLSQVSFTHNVTRSRATRGGGARGRIKGFSSSSRRNLLRHMANINRASFRAYKGRVFSVTLTYPNEWPEDPEACKKQLKALHKRMKRRFGEFACFWRLGIQQGGAWHFHLLLFMPSLPGLLDNLRSFVSSSWYEVCGKIDEGHLLAGPNVQEIRNWRRATSYAEKYMAKEEEFPKDLRTGRIWGVWNKEFLPIRWETVRVSFQDALRIRRVHRKLARRRGSGALNRITVFVRYENVVRLLEFLGYCLE